MSAEYRFVCEKCNYKTNLKSVYDAHCKSVLHQTGKRKIRSDKKADIYNCEKCDYKTYNEHNLKLHVLNNHGTQEDRKTGFIYYCKDCDFGVNVRQLYDRHCETLKHKRRLNNL